MGLIAITLCPIVIGAEYVFGEGEFFDSVSANYGGAGRNWFVGGLIAIAVFMHTYESQTRDGEVTSDRRWDRILSTAAGLCAAVVALFPTGPDAVGHLHLAAALGLLSICAIFNLYFFTKTGGERHLSSCPCVGSDWMRLFRTNWRAIAAHAPAEKQPTPRKFARNLIYRSCGWVIVVCLIVAGVVKMSPELGLKQGPYYFFTWAEIIAVSAFGLSWLVKGEAFGLLRDDMVDNGRCKANGRSETTRRRTQAWSPRQEIVSTNGEVGASV